MNLVATFLVWFERAVDKFYDWLMNRLEPMFDAMDAAEERLNSKEDK